MLVDYVTAKENEYVKKRDWEYSTWTYNQLGPDWHPVGTNLKLDNRRMWDREVEITALGDKWQVTATLAGTLLGELLPLQVIFTGKTEKCHHICFSQWLWCVAHPKPLSKWRNNTSLHWKHHHTLHQGCPEQTRDPWTTCTCHLRCV